MKTLSLLAVLTAAAVLPLAAQQPGAPKPAAPRPHMAPGHGMMMGWR